MYKKEYENTLTYDISYKTATGGKPLRFRFEKIDRFIRVHGDEIRHLVLFDCGLFDKICDRINDLISEKSCITDSINNLEKSELIHIIIYLLKKYWLFIILIKPVLNKNENNYYYNMFLEKDLYNDKSNTWYF